MPKVRIPPPYRGPTRGESLIEVPGETVRQCVDAIEARHPGFSEQVFDAQGNAHGFVTLFVNGDEIDRSAVDRPVGEADEIEILAAVAGG